MRRANQVRHNMKPEIRTGLGLGQGQYKKYSALRDSRRRIILPTPWGFRGSKTVTFGGEGGRVQKLLTSPREAGAGGFGGPQAPHPQRSAKHGARSPPKADGGLRGRSPPATLFFCCIFYSSKMRKKSKSPTGYEVHVV